jgi:hypothetical protein
MENWTSFRDKVEFSLVAGPERQHGERLARLAKYRMRVLPVTAIYGGNASGKSNLFKGLRFMQRLVARGTQPDELIQIEPFLLNSDTAGGPVAFGAEILVNDVIYDYRFSVTKRRVVTESLVKVLSTREVPIYERDGNEISFGEGLSNDQFLGFAFQGTRENQLFLTNAVSQNVESFRPVYAWFRDVLTLIDPDSSFEPFELLTDTTSPLSREIESGLHRLDTGITRLVDWPVDFEAIPLPAQLREDIKQGLLPGGLMRLHVREANERYLISRDDDGVVSARKLLAAHTRDDGVEVEFELNREADGTQRVIDLLPAFCDIGHTGCTKVYFVDELDRSLHTLLTRALLSSYLDGCGPDSRSQLVFTTHDLLLMDQALLRRDEMWVTDRDSSGASSLVSLSEYEGVRYDKDVRKSYLQGRLGGIPRILISQ